jgi:hypothetical protein
MTKRKKIDKNVINTINDLIYEPKIRFHTDYFSIILDCLNTGNMRSLNKLLKQSPEISYWIPKIPFEKMDELSEKVQLTILMNSFSDGEFNPTIKLIKKFKFKEKVLYDFSKHLLTTKNTFTIADPWYILWLYIINNKGMSYQLLHYIKVTLLQFNYFTNQIVKTLIYEIENHELYNPANAILSKFC